MSQNHDFLKVPFNEIDNLKKGLSQTSVMTFGGGNEFYNQN